MRPKCRPASVSRNSGASTNRNMRGIRLDDLIDEHNYIEPGPFHSIFIISSLTTNTEWTEIEENPIGLGSIALQVGSAVAP